MNRLDFGLFLPTTSGNLVFGSECRPEDLPSFEVNRRVLESAENAGFDFALSQAKWRGYGGPSRQWDFSLEAFSLIAALAATTSKLQLYASVAVRTLHPVVVAKMAATIDNICNGRFGVNVVAGWNKAEYEQMGLWDEDAYYNYRYKFAEEYVTVLRKLWTEDATDFDGRFFHLKDCHSFPKPGRHLPIVSAGQSPEAVEFIARYADIAFVGRMSDDAEGLGKLSTKIRAAAGEQGRDVGTYVLMDVVAAETDDKALAICDAYVEKADMVAIANWSGLQGADPNKAPAKPQERPVLQKAFMGTHLNAGSYGTVARRIDEMAAHGVGGVCLTFPDFEGGLATFFDKVLPLCKSYAPKT